MCRARDGARGLARAFAIVALAGLLLGGRVAAVTVPQGVPQAGVPQADAPQASASARPGPGASPGPVRPPAWATAAAPLVLRGVTVIDVARGVGVPDQTVVVVGRRLQALGPTAQVAVPAGAHVVDARGKYVIPGLWDLHLHLLQLTPDGTAPAEVGYRLLIANGVTGIRDPGSDVPLATTRRWKQEIAAGTRVGPRLFVVGPALVDCPANPSFTHQLCVATPEEARHVVDSLAAAGADLIKTYVDDPALYFALASEATRVGLPFGGHLPQGVDGLEASDSGARFLDHQTYFTDDVCHDWSYHAAPSDSAPCRAAAARLRRNDTWVVPSPLGLYVPATSAAPRAAAIGRYLEERRWRYLPTALLEGRDRDSALAVLEALPAAARAPATSTAEWRAVFFGDTTASWGSGDAGEATPKAEPSPDSSAEPRPDPRPDTSAVRPKFWGLAGWGLKAAAGLPMVAGTDAVLGPSIFLGLPGFRLQETLENLVLSGASPAAALQLATRNAAQALHLSDSLGTLAAGKIADLVLLDADPLADLWHITRIRAVVADGHYYDRAALDQLLVEAARAARQP